METALFAIVCDLRFAIRDRLRSYGNQPLISPEKPTDRMNHEGMSVISVFPRNLQSNSPVRQLIFLNRKSFKRKQANPQQANGKGKKPFQSQLSKASE